MRACLPDNLVVLHRCPGSTFPLANTGRRRRRAATGACSPRREAAFPHWRAVLQDCRGLPLAMHANFPPAFSRSVVQRGTEPQALRTLRTYPAACDQCETLRAAGGRREHRGQRGALAQCTVRALGLPPLCCWLAPASFGRATTSDSPPTACDREEEGVSSGGSCKAAGWRLLHKQVTVEKVDRNSQLIYTGGGASQRGAQTMASAPSSPVSLP